MHYLSIFTPARNDGPPSPEHMAAMGQLIEEMTRNGKLVTTGGLGRRATGAFAVARKDGAFTVDEKPCAVWMLAGGFSITAAASRADAIADAKRFLDVAGDGTSEVIELAFAPSHLRQGGG
jgi:hypothetical protein